MINKKNSDLLVLLIFGIGLFFGYLQIDGGVNSFVSLVNRLFVYHGYPKTIFYVGTYLCSILGIVFLYTSESLAIRSFSYLVTFVSVMIWLSYKYINSYGFGYNEARTAINEFVFAGEAVSTFSASLVRAFGVSILTVGILEICSRNVLPKVKKRYALLALAMILPIYAVNVRTMGGISKFPIFFQVPIISFVAYADSPPFGPREKPEIEPVNDPISNHIMLIVDESVRGDILGINDYKVPTTPYLNSIASQLLNFGVAISSTNCSSTTHIVLQTALQLDQLPDKDYKTLKVPTLFQYAKKAGFTTYVIDGQATKPPNYLSEYELKYIDNYVTYDTFSKGGYEVDYKIVDQIADILDNKDKAFIYVIKKGCHFNYDNDYPASARKYMPTMTDAEEYSVDVILNSYYNALLWNVDGFFKKLIPQITGKDLTLIYTSDHGQSIEAFKRIPATHCVGKGAPLTQAMVPLFIFPRKKIINEKKGFSVNNISKNINKTSHYNIVPTLLIFMGYSQKDVNEYAGSTVFDTLSDDRAFVTGGLYGRGYFKKVKFQIGSQ